MAYQRFTVEILAHHGRTCPYCRVIMRVPATGTRGKASNRPSFPTRDHVYPKSRVPAQGTLIVCRRCNIDKGNRTLREWLSALVEASDPRSVFVADLMRKEFRLERDPARSAGIKVVEVRG